MRAVPTPTAAWCWPPAGVLLPGLPPARLPLSRWSLIRYVRSGTRTTGTNVVLSDRLGVRVDLEQRPQRRLLVQRERYAFVALLRCGMCH